MKKRKIVIAVSALWLLFLFIIGLMFGTSRLDGATKSKYDEVEELLERTRE